MSDASPSSGQRTSSVNLVRSSHPWTKADSAAGFVLRYLAPMRRQLIALLGSEQQADEALKLLLAHLVSAGFGDYKNGRLRDFLVRGLRSAAKSRLSELPKDETSHVDLEQLTIESKEWLRLWREGLLERAWRSLERKEHAEPDSPVYSVLHLATTNPGATPEMLAVQVNTEFGLQIDQRVVREVLPEARAMFAQLVADEVAETLETPTIEEVKREIGQLGLGKAFAGLNI
jgi:hypothetical protein